jgi:hypothetical protein
MDQARDNLDQEVAGKGSFLSVWTTYEIDPYHVQLFFESYCVRGG